METITKKRLVIISNMFPNNFNIYGGIFVYEQLKSISRLNKYQITVISPVPYIPKILWFKNEWRNRALIDKEAKMGKSKNIRVIYVRYFSIPGR